MLHKIMYLYLMYGKKYLYVLLIPIQSITKKHNQKVNLVQD